MLKVNCLAKSIRGKQILKDLSFEIDHGKIAIFLGGSGVGKSTLLRVLNNLEGYEYGYFTLDGTPLNLELVSRNHAVGMVFQHFNLFEHMNVEDNIVLPLTVCKGINKEMAGNIARQLLKRYGLQDHFKAKISQLSGGQKQRLAIARTLSLDPKIICLDEPTSALDPRLTNQVAQYIKELAAENRIILLTTHDMGLVEQLEGQLFLMKDGTIVERGSKSELLASPLLYPKLHQFLAGADPV